MKEEMQNDSKDETQEEPLLNKGMSRRDILKILCAGAIAAIIPACGSSSAQSSFSSASGPGLIFLVGDGMPLGVIRGMHEISTQVFKNKDTHIYSIMRNPQATVSYMGTSSLTSIVTDSAPATVAWATGSKTANLMLACLPDGRPLKTIMELLKERDYACGFVTTTRVTHATPAGWVSHNKKRDAEDEIGLDYLTFKPDVLLGGGSRHFDPARRTDKKDLFTDFANAGYDVVRDKNSLENIITSTKKLFGIFNSSHMSYYVDRASSDKEPSLPLMTRIALQKLSRNPKGFIVQIEAGRIDHANHANDAWGAIMDTYEMDLTIAVIKEYMDKNPNTLLIITSDHGNAGWGINGTGPEYNDATEALKKYAPITASFEVMGAQMKGKPANEVREIFKNNTGYILSDIETNMIFESMQAGYKPFPGDFLYYPDAMLGRILSHSEYDKDNKPVIRRGNVGFTSTNHTAEDQIVIAYGQMAKQLGIAGYIENTELFRVMCRYFGITHTNPTMTTLEAKSLIKPISSEQWARHMKWHIS